MPLLAAACVCRPITFFRMGGDDEMGVFAQFYQLPWVATRSLVWGGTPETALGMPSSSLLCCVVLWCGVVWCAVQCCVALCRMLSRQMAVHVLGAPDMADSRAPNFLNNHHLHLSGCRRPKCRCIREVQAHVGF